MYMTVEVAESLVKALGDEIERATDERKLPLMTARSVAQAKLAIATDDQISLENGSRLYKEAGRLGYLI